VAGQLPLTTLAHPLRRPHYPEMTGMQWLSANALPLGVGLTVFVALMARRGLERRNQRLDAENRLAEEGWSPAPQDGFDAAWRRVDLDD
jgi:hypothetical protein